MAAAAVSSAWENQKLLQTFNRPPAKRAVFLLSGWYGSDGIGRRSLFRAEPFPMPAAAIPSVRGNPIPTVADVVPSVWNNRKDPSYRTANRPPVKRAVFLLSGRSDADKGRPRPLRQRPERPEITPQSPAPKGRGGKPTPPTKRPEKAPRPTTREAGSFSLPFIPFMIDIAPTRCTLPSGATSPVTRCTARLCAASLPQTEPRRHDRQPLRRERMIPAEGHLRPFRQDRKGPDNATIARTEGACGDRPSPQNGKIRKGSTASRLRSPFRDKKSVRSEAACLSVENFRPPRKAGAFCPVSCALPPVK